YFLVPATSATNVLTQLLRFLYFLPCWALYGVIHLLDALTMRASQRAEYRADVSAARVGSTEAAVSLMDRMLLCDMVDRSEAKQKGRGAFIPSRQVRPCARLRVMIPSRKGHAA
ncbi:hypothetical protein ACFWXG_40205, partial [Streptomyces sp. NPDC059072]